MYISGLVDRNHMLNVSRVHFCYIYDFLLYLSPNVACVLEGFVGPWVFHVVLTFRCWRWQVPGREILQRCQDRDHLRRYFEHSTSNHRQRRSVLVLWVRAWSPVAPPALSSPSGHAAFGSKSPPKGGAVQRKSAKLEQLELATSGAIWGVLQSTLSTWWSHTTIHIEFVESTNIWFKMVGN